MLWLRYEGGQLPIGWASGAVATITLYGKQWKLYQGKNLDTGITVSSLLVDPNNQYIGDFSGDIKEWLLAMSKQGIFSTNTYVNVGNAGMEPFWVGRTFVPTSLQDTDRDDRARSTLSTPSASRSTCRKQCSIPSGIYSMQNLSVCTTDKTPALDPAAHNLLDIFHEFKKSNGVFHIAMWIFYPLRPGDASAV